MAIPLFVTTAQGGQILSLDDQTAHLDQIAADGSGGFAYSPRLLSSPFSVAAYGRIRRLVQMVQHSGDLTLTVTPWRDGQATGLPVERDIVSSDPSTVTVPLDGTGTEFQLEVVVSDFTSEIELGGGEITVSPRRTQR